MSNRDVINRPEAKFQRRRCPSCGSGKYKRLLQTDNPNLRACECGRVFHLFNDGVRPIDADKPVREKSGVIPTARRGDDFKPLRRDPFELMRLAVLTRA